ncbi:metal-dependent phosphoesterase [Aeromicrobium sp. Root495]|uniref:PHP domain-containing protein n=1 Tax=Aeromicrobium sp. Root495 TaxID=1736550 RepID=UPI0006F89E96|nr:PHP domain-containing protein [Aeromicrobium sp. Root495]KQY59919.1 metal-dependent phosphoesterase [Aeromicrobium sp. Root495]
MRIDLHTHSNRSDGTDSPAQLVRNAREVAGLDVVALTDHDATTGWDEAAAEADRVGIRLVRGIEISTTFQGESVHLLGYELDPTDAALTAELDRVLGGRDDRLPRVLEKLAEHGMPITLEEVAAQSGNAAASGRPHIADAMVAKGYIKDRDEAFDGWLNTNGRAYVERYSAPLVRAVQLVKAAGGRAVVAHPWSRGSDRVLTPAVFGQLQEAGLDGIEVDHNDHSDATRATLRGIAQELGLVVTGSSDYHGTGKSEQFRLGANLTAPEELERLLG